MSSRAYIRTITGDISPGEATAALTHEHFLCHFRRDPLPPARLAELETLLTRDLRHLRSAGCNMLVDAGTMLGYWRPMELYRRLSQQTGVYVVACTGGYVEDCIPPALRRLSVSRLATFLRKEIVEGIEGTGIRAGVIKVASARTLQPAERPHVQGCSDRPPGNRHAHHLPHGGEHRLPHGVLREGGRGPGEGDPRPHGDKPVAIGSQWLHARGSCWRSRTSAATCSASRRR